MTTPSDEILTAAKDLLDLDPPRAEIWISGLLADLDPSTHDELIAAMASAGTPESVCLAATLAVVGEGDLAARSAKIAAATDVEGPWWLTALGSASAIDARRVLLDGESASLIIRFMHASGERHLLLVDIDDGKAIDIRLAPDGLLEDEPDDETIMFEPVEVGAAAEEIADAIRLTAPNESSIAMNIAVARRRIEAVRRGDLSMNSSESPMSIDDVGERDEDGNAAAIGVLESALASHFSIEPDPGLFAEKAAELRAPVDSATADVDAVFGAAGLTGAEPDDQLVLRFIGAYASPRQLVLFGVEERQAIRHLEWADWLGAVIGIVRAGAGCEVTPAGLVKAINRCPEITTTIPKSDADYVAWAFELALHGWSMVGVLDEDDRLTEFGVAVLPFALRATWQPRSEG